MVYEGRARLGAETAAMANPFVGRRPQWFRARVLDLTGVDLAAPPDGPPPAVLIDYRA